MWRGVECTTRASPSRSSTTDWPSNLTQNSSFSRPFSGIWLNSARLPRLETALYPTSGSPFTKYCYHDRSNGRQTKERGNYGWCLGSGLSLTEILKFWGVLGGSDIVSTTWQKFGGNDEWCDIGIEPDFSEPDPSPVQSSSLVNDLQLCRQALLQ